MSSEIVPSTSDRLLRALRELIRAQFPRLTYLGVWEYAVQASPGAGGTGTVDAAPVDPSISLPGITGLQLRPSVLGENVVPVVGSVCLVAFVNGDPTRPVVVGGDYANAPSSAQLMGGGPAVSRVGDTVTSYLVLGGPSSPQPGATIGSYQTNALALAAIASLNAATAGSAQPTPTQFNAWITSGSGKLQSG
ncbi:MAG: hypothetical protein NVS3B10_00090 [Polyangiales bacterium]